jgi:hypothetical protein
MGENAVNSTDMFDMSPEEYLEVITSINRIPSREYLKNGRCLMGFLMQLVDFSERKIFNHYEILDEIAYLEGIKQCTRTKDDKGKPFIHEPLKGLYHKHFSTAMHIPRNIGIGTGLLFGKSSSKYSKRIDDILQKHDGEMFNDEINWKIVNATVHKTLKERCGKFTGDWIIFEKDKNGINTYLTIALHDEPAQVIYDRIEKYRKHQAKILSLCSNLK